MGLSNLLKMAFPFLKSRQNFFLFYAVLALISARQAFTAEYSIQDIALTPGKDISEINLAWYSTTNTNSLVQIAPKTAMQNQEFPAAASVSHYTTRSAAVSGYYSHKAVLTSLTASTEYVYRVGDGNADWSPVYELKTGAPDQFSLFAMGDPQVNDATDIAGWIATLNTAFNTFPATDFILSVGDQVHINNDESQFAGFLSHPQLKSVPLAPALGNHDDGAYNTAYHFNLPNLSTAYGVTDPGIGNYYFTYGNMIIIVLNSNNRDGESHEVFISNAIAAHPNATWKIVMFHHDIYGAGPLLASDSSVRTDLRTALYPVMDTYKIDLVLTGHDHLYTRTHFMKNDIPQLDQFYDENEAVIHPTGTVYFTLNSASGSKYLDPAGTYNYAAVISQNKVPSFSRLSVNNNQLTIDTYQTDNTESPIDTLTIIKDVSLALGDVNHDTKIDIIDALSLARYSVGLVPPNFDVTLADVNCDNSVDIIDALVAAQFYVGLLSGFCK